MDENISTIKDPFDKKLPKNLGNIFSNEKICIVEDEITKTEKSINQINNQEIKDKFLKELNKIIDEYSKENGDIKEETKLELLTLSNESELSNLGVEIKKKKDKNGDEFNYINLENINSDENLKTVLSITKNDEYLNQGLMRSIGDPEFKNILLKNTTISKNFDLIINNVFKLFCPDEKLLKESKIIIDGIQNYERSIEIVLNKIPEKYKEKAKAEFNNLFDTTKNKALCSHSIINEITRIFNENGGKGISDGEIKNILQTGVESQLIKEELSLNINFEEKLKKFGKNSIKDLTKEEIKTLLEDSEVGDDKKEELKRFLANNEKNEKVIKDFTTEDVRTARNSDKEDFQNYLKLKDSISGIENYVFKEYGIDLKFLNNNDILDLIVSYKKIGKKEHKELIALLESYLELKKQKVQINKKIDDNELNKEINISKNAQSKLDYSIPINGKPSFIEIEGTNDKITITKNGDKFIVKIGESIEECSNEKELDNVINAGKLLAQNGLSCIIGDIKNIMNILSKKFQFNFDAKDGLDNEEIKLFFAGILHTIGEGNFNDLKNKGKDEIFDKFRSFKFKNETMLTKFQKSGIVGKEDNKFSILAFENKLSGIDSSKI